MRSFIAGTCFFVALNVVGAALLFCTTSLTQQFDSVAVTCIANFAAIALTLWLAKKSLDAIAFISQRPRG